MAKITFYQLGNADSYRIDLDGGEKLLFDYANMRCGDKPEDKRADLPAELRKDLKAAGRDAYDVVAFTHFDDDHVCGAAEFFELRHAAKYQGGDRIKITELWVPAWAITESRAELCADGKILQAEAQFRLEQGEGIRVFSRPAKLEAWLEARGLTLASRQNLITDAGQLVPGWSKATQGVEFFVHSPFASRQDDGTLDDRNSNSLVFQAVFLAGGVESKALLMADTEHACMQEIVKITRAKKRDERLEWDLVKLPHHCSYLSLGPEKGTDKTVPVPEVAWIYETQGRLGSRIVSTSDPIPHAGDQTQPPHRQAANYYRPVMKDVHGGEFLVTMEHPSVAAPAPLVVRIDGFGVTAVKASAAVGAGATSQPAPRAG
jgi:beta-lactamase superfamily II metal-dependent hydrolase